MGPHGKVARADVLEGTHGKGPAGPMGPQFGQGTDGPAVWQGPIGPRSLAMEQMGIERPHLANSATGVPRWASKSARDF